MNDTTRQKIDTQVDNNLGARLLKRFSATDYKEIDLGFGDVIKMKIPKTFSEYSALLEQAKIRYKESGQEDDNFIYCYLLESVIQNLNALEIEQIVFSAPGLCEVLLKSLDTASGNVISRLEAEMIEESKKESRKMPLGEPV